MSSNSRKQSTTIQPCQAGFSLSVAFFDCCKTPKHECACVMGGICTTGAKVHEDVGTDGKAAVRRLLMGNISGLSSINQPTGKLCIFVSSTFTDTHEERNVLLQDILPALQARARANGVAVMFSDMRFGIKDESTKEHDTWEVCVKEIDRCFKESDGLFFLSLQGDKYGYQPLPKYLPVTALDRLGDASLQCQEMFKQWYTRDRNALPSGYVLKPLPDDKASQGQYWNTVLPQLSEALQDISFGKTATGTDLLVKHSVTEWETKYALDLSAARSIHFHRRFDPHTLQNESKPDFCDVIGKPEDASKLASLLVLIASRLDANCSYPMGVVDVGCFHRKDQQFAEYMSKWKNTAQDVLDNELTKSILKSSEWNGNALGSGIPGKVLDECFHHLRLQAERCDEFFGREGLIKESVDMACFPRGNGSSEMYKSITMCVVGVSGSGKTSLMSVLAKHMHKGKSSIPVIIRYCGSSNMTCDGLSLIRSIIWQVNHVYGLPQQGDGWPALTSYEKAVELFQKLLHDYPVVLVIDSLDQLDNAYEERSAISFLKNCSPHKQSVIIVSTLPDEKHADGSWRYHYQCDSLLEMHNIPRITVPVLDIHREQDVKALFAHQLQRKKRTLQDSQWKTVWKSVQTEPTVLYLTLACTAASRWKSDEVIGEEHLRGSVAGVVNQMFDRLEKTYGLQLMRHVLGFLTFSKSGELILRPIVRIFLTFSTGVSDLEMVDLLSCRDEVLDEVFQYSKLESVRRVPVHVWLRVRQEISSMLVEKSNGTLRWYHRQLWEAARARLQFLENLPHVCHQTLSQYFANLVPPDILHGRQIMSQEMMLASPSQSMDVFQSDNLGAVWLQDSVVNVRRCTEAVHQLIQCEQYEEAVQEACDIGKVCAIVRAGQGYELLKSFNALNFEKSRLSSKSAKLFDHFRRWLLADMSALVLDPFGELLATALLQPKTSLVRIAVEQQVFPIGKLKWTCRSFSGTEGFSNMLLNLSGHTNFASCVCMTSDCSKVISGSFDSTIKIWSTESGQCLSTLKGHRMYVNSVSISADNSKIVSTALDKTVKLWDMESGKCLRTFEGHTGDVTCACMSSDGKWIVSGSNDKTLRIWDAATGQCTRTMQVAAKVTAVCISPDDSRIYSANDSINIWNVSGECLNTLDARLTSGFGSSMSLSSDGLWIVLAKGAVIKLWEAQSGQLAATIETDHHNIKSAVLVPDRMLVVAGGMDNVVKVWSLQGDCLNALEGHSSYITGVCVSPHSMMVASSSQDNTVKVWDILCASYDNSNQGHKGRVNTVSVTADGQLIISGSDDKTVKVWDFTGRCLHTFTDDALTAGAVHWVWPSLDGSRVYALNSLGYALNVWDLQTGCSSLLLSLESGIVGCAMSADCTRFAAIFKELKEPVRIYDALSGECLQSLHGHAKQGASVCIYAAVCISPDGNHIATASGDHTVKVWSMADGECLFTTTSGDSASSVTSMAISPDGSTIVMGAMNGTIVISAFPSCECLFTSEPQGGCINSICISPDGRRFAFGLEDVFSGTVKAIQVWDLRSFRCLSVLLGHSNAVKSVCFTPDGRGLVSGSKDSSVLVWQCVEDKEKE